MKLYTVTYDWTDWMGTHEHKAYFNSRESAEKYVAISQKVYRNKTNYKIEEDPRYA